MIVKMAKIRIVGSKEILMAVLEFLQEKGVVHFESKPREIRRINHLSMVRKLTVEEVTRQTKSSLESVLGQVERILRFLPETEENLQKKAPPLPSGFDPPELKKTGDRLSPLLNRIEKLHAKRKAHEDDLSLLSRYQKVLKVLYPMVSRVRESRDLEFTGLVIHDEGRAVMKNLEAGLERLTGRRYELFHEKVNSDTIAALLVLPKEEMKKVKGILQEESIGRLRLPPSIMDKPLNEAVRIIMGKQRELPKRIHKINRELEEISQRWYGPLEALRHRLEDRIDQILVSSSFFETDRTFLIFGWIPGDGLESIRVDLKERFGKRVVLEPLNVSKTERGRVPVTLRNPSWVEPYEVFTRLLPLPRYGTVDPTPFIAGFFPLFFGMIVGDIGYGVIIFILALYLRHRFRANRLVRDIATVFSIGAVSCVLWGFAFGEFFGDLGEEFGLHPILMDRMEDFISTLYLALALGVVHILLGISLGIYTAVRQGERSEIISKVAGLFVLSGFLSAAGSGLGFLPSWMLTAGLITGIVFIPVLILGGGRSGAMELHNLVNVLSYLRLMGIGVASVALAFAANTLGGLAGNVVLGILIALFLHLINIVFAVFSPTIQTLRLHYVEFFENFFKGGGTAYRPFRKAA